MSSCTAIVAELVVPVNSHSPSLDVTLRCLSLDATGERMACVMRHGPLYTVNLQYAKVRNLYVRFLPLWHDVLSADTNFA